jgi:hypothetical protein
LAWIIYRTPEDVSRTPDIKGVFDVANDAARREGVNADAMSADLRRRDELLDRLKDGKLIAYGLGRGRTMHCSIPRTDWDTIDSFHTYDPSRGDGPRDVGSSNETSARYREVFAFPEDVLQLWPASGAHQGLKADFPGRPSLKEPIFAELKARVERRVECEKVAAESRYLYSWVREKYPGDSRLPGKPRSVENMIRDEYRTLRVKRDNEYRPRN